MCVCVKIGPCQNTLYVGRPFLIPAALGYSTHLHQSAQTWCWDIQDLPPPQDISLLEAIFGRLLLSVLFCRKIFYRRPWGFLCLPGLYLIGETKKSLLPSSVAPFKATQTELSFSAGHFRRRPWDWALFHRDPTERLRKERERSMRVYST